MSSQAAQAAVDAKHVHETVETDGNGTGQNQLHRRLKGRHMQMIAMQVSPNSVARIVLIETVVVRSVLVYSSTPPALSRLEARVRCFSVSSSLVFKCMSDLPDFLRS
jgi:hypothetical protein